MHVHFWGTRGSLPSTFSSQRLEPKIRKALSLARGQSLDRDEDIDEFVASLPFSVRGTYGTNTSCVEIRGSEEYIICDCGSGLRDFSSYVMDQHHATPQVFHIFMSHLHWDHISGFPFFVPAYVPGNKINIYGLHKNLEQAFRQQQSEPSFPIPLDFMAADIEFHTLEKGKEYTIGGCQINTIEQNHPGVSYGYAFEREGQKIVYSTDSEHTIESNSDDYPFIDFFRDADVLIFDAQYELFEAIDTKANWGHSSNVIGVELAVRSGVKRLCLFHNEHTADDDTLARFLQETKNYLSIYDEAYKLDIHLSYDGLEIDCS